MLIVLLSSILVNAFLFEDSANEYVLIYDKNKAMNIVEVDKNTKLGTIFSTKI